MFLFAKYTEISSVSVGLFESVFVGVSVGLFVGVSVGLTLGPIDG